MEDKMDGKKRREAKGEITMKIEAREDGLVLHTESDFDVLALKRWVGRKATVLVETYEKNESRFGKDAHASGFMRVHFKEEK